MTSVGMIKTICLVGLLTVDNKFSDFFEKFLHDRVESMLFFLLLNLTPDYYLIYTYVSYPRKFRFWSLLNFSINQSLIIL